MLEPKRPAFANTSYASGSTTVADYQKWDVAIIASLALAKRLCCREEYKAIVCSTADDGIVDGSRIRNRLLEGRQKR